MAGVIRTQLVDANSGARRALKVELPEDATTDDLASALAPFGGGALFVDAAPISEHKPMADVALLHGSSISVGVAVQGPRVTPASGYEIRVVAGPGAGFRYPLHVGRHLIGRSEEAAIRLPDPEVSATHAELALDADGNATVTDLQSTNGTVLESTAVTSERPLRPGEQFQVGSTLLEFAWFEIEPLPHERRGSVIELSRRFRTKSPEWVQHVRFPKPVDTEEPQLTSPANLALTIAPALVLAVVALVMGRPEMLIFCAASPLVGIGRWFLQRRQWRQQNQSNAEKYVAARAKAEKGLLENRAAERESLRLAAPDLAELGANVKLPGRRLWERDVADGDFLRVRLGVATRTSSVRAEGGEEAEAETAKIWRAPVAVDLRSAGCLGIVGPPPVVRRLGGAAVLHLAASDAPSQLRIVVVTAGGAADDWGWVQWLPHCHYEPDDPFVLIGNTESTRAKRLEELQALVRLRAQQVADREAGVALPTVVVVLDGATELVRQGFGDILIEGPAVGVHSICLDADQIPSQCKATVTVAGRLDECRFEQVGEPPVLGLLVDLPDPTVLDSVARALAPLRPVNEMGRGVALPHSVRLLEVLDLEQPSAEKVLERWGESRPTASAVVGTSGQGSLRVDLPRQGPHALLAGMTRSGKSEFVKTLVASLALSHHPDDLSFLFVDFKKGDDYRLLRKLPHAIGLVTSRDLEDFERTIRLLSSEISRRSDLFGEAQATTIEAYGTARSAQRSLPPVGRLIVVADEFAELAMRAPEQLAELVSVARTGAAFGVHLVLATQLPSRSSVTPQIDANVGLRVSFRSNDPEGSAVVIGVPDASYIAERDRGRGFLKGQGRPMLEFQSGRVGGPRGGVVQVQSARADLVLWHELGLVPEEERGEEVPDPDTDLWDVVMACRTAAERSGWAANAVPWPQPLPTSVHLGELDDVEGEESIPFLLVDDVTGQRHATGGLSRHDGVFVVAGSPRTGRTTALRSAAAASAVRLPSDQNRMYVLDFVGGALRPVALFPHCVGAAFDDWEQATRVVRQLSDEVSARLESFAEHGFAGIADQRHRASSAGQEPLPYLTLLIDGWEAVVEEGSRFGLVEQLTQLLSRGQAVGLQGMVAGDRSATTGKMGRLARHRLVLECSDANGYAACGVDHRMVPSEMPPGRGILLPAGAIAQVALVGEGDGGEAGALAALADQLKDRERQMGIQEPERVEPLPKTVSLSPLLEMQPPPVGGVQAMLGLSAGSRRLLWVDLTTSARSMFVVGPPGSGRTSALTALAASFGASGCKVVVIAAEPDRFSKVEGVVVSMTPADLSVRSIPELAADADVLVIDDAESIASDAPDMVALLARADRPAVVASFGRAAGLESPAGWVASLRRSKTGLLLSPASKYDGSIFGGRLSEEMVFSGPPGRAVAGHAGGVEIVQVPLHES